MNALGIIIGIGMIIAFLAICAVSSAFGALVVWALYNGVVVSAFGTPALTYLQTWGFLLLLSIVGGLIGKSN